MITKLCVFSKLQLAKRIRRQQGQTLVEYALILALVALTATAALTFLFDSVDEVFSEIGEAVEDV